jgi:hypothetical protein
MIRPNGEGEGGHADTNREALQEYAHIFGSSGSKPSHSPVFADPDKAILSLPSLPLEPEPLSDWYASSEVENSMTSFVHDHLFPTWRQQYRTD